MYHIFIEIYFCDKYYAQEEIFHICGEEVNLYLAGVNRFKEIQNIKYKERKIWIVRYKIWDSKQTQDDIKQKYKIRRRLSELQSYRAEEDDDGPAYWN